MKALAFSDLCQVSEERGISTCRRRSMFRSEGKEAQIVWNKVAAECLTEVQGLIVHLGICVAKEHSMTLMPFPQYPKVFAAGFCILQFTLVVQKHSLF